MISSLLIALAAGAASAVMFASIVSGALISIFLFYLAPLPLMVACLGWGPMTATIGGIAAATSLGLLFGMGYLAIFAVTIALPAWWLGHLALLGRPVEAPASVTGNSGPAMEWYPIGRILLWIAVFASITTMAALLTLGTDSETILGALKRSFARIMTGRTEGDTDNIAAAIAMIAPPAASVVAIITLTLNLWLAGRITSTSGRLKRPWPDLRTLALPPMTLVALCVAIALTFLGGIVGMFAQIVSATLLMAYALTGFATLHALTIGMRSRTLVLSLIYAMVLVLGWPMLVMACLGLADAFFGFRRRLGERQPPETAA
ncbi:hypothetical protein E0H22_12135 [Rhodopseudomonas boonkerdii]|uniref:hypothetical protein n=1 Tax=Rhodopseudomonas boonkerdii TaxID=475937 RepID=UPI001E492E69|nr:hypothetical protein [Rhodopseudomonas boonkerdii]UGV26372.1 hypothetical protein E0H22_12135 [Rhodopseudomonas boonkerdii]